MRHWSKPALFVAFLFGPLLVSCLYSPVGTNKAVGIYPSPVGGTITLPYTPTSTSIAKVSFAIANLTSVTIPDSDTKDSGFKAVIDVSKIPAGIYVVDVTEDAATSIAGHLTLVVPSGADTGATGATGAATPAASPDAGTTGTAGATPAGQ
jgi:hypothetical protein